MHGKCSPLPLVAGPGPLDKMTYVGPSGAGKTRAVVDLLLHPQSPWEHVFVFAPEMSLQQAEYKRLKDGPHPVTFHRGVPEDEEAERALEARFAENKAKGIPQVAVYDDLFVTTKSGRGQKWLQQMAISGRHAGVGQITLLQVPMGDRVARQQQQWMILYDNPIGDSIHHLARQLDPLSKGRRVLRAWKQATVKPYGHLIVDMRPGAGLMKYRDSAWDKCFQFDQIV